VGCHTDRAPVGASARTEGVSDLRGLGRICIEATPSITPVSSNRLWAP
jgi:hypothetical protein